MTRAGTVTSLVTGAAGFIGNACGIGFRSASPPLEERLQQVVGELHG